MTLTHLTSTHKHDSKNMKEFAYFLIYCLIVAAIAGLIRLWRKYSAKLWSKLYTATHAKTMHYDADTVKQIISDAIAGINSRGDWHKNTDDADEIIFEYQSGNFVIMLSKDKPQFAQLRFLFFYQTSVENLNEVRMLINTININADKTTITYSLPDDEPNVDVHAMSALYVTSGFNADALRQYINDIFGWRQAFVQHIGQRISRHTRENIDEDMLTAEYGFAMRLVGELEMERQQGPALPRYCPTERPQLGTLVSLMTGIDSFLPISMTVLTADGKATTVGADDIRSYDITTPFTTATGNGAQASCACATIALCYRQKAFPDHERNMTISLNRERSDGDTTFIRMTVTIVPLTAGINTPYGNAATRPLTVSSLIAYDHTDPTTALAKFRYLRKEAEDARRNGHDDPDDALAAIMYDCLDDDTAYSVYNAKRLFTQKCYAEALAPLLNVAARLMHDIRAGKRLPEKLTCDIFFMTGTSLYMLGRYDRAIHYLDLVSNDNNIIHWKMHINALIAGDDPRAMSYIDQSMTYVSGLIASNDDDDDDDNDGEADNQRRMLAFLKRRKAHLLADEGSADKAEQLLTQMITDGEEPELARNELTYVRGKNAAPHHADAPRTDAHDAPQQEP